MKSNSRVLATALVSTVTTAVLAAPAMVLAQDESNEQARVRQVHARGAPTFDHTISVKRLMELDVRNAEGEDIGDVEDLLVDTNDGEMYVIVSVGEYLGMADKLIAVPYNQLQSSGDDGMRLDVSKEQLMDRPDFGYGETVSAYRPMEAVKPATDIAAESSLAVAAPESTDDTTTGGSDESIDAEAAEAEERNAYLARMQLEVSRWDEKVQELGGSASEQGHALSEESREVVKESWSGVQSTWYTLQGASGELWRDTKATFEEAWQKFRQTWNENVEQEQQAS